MVDGVIYSNASIASGLYTVTGSGSAARHGPRAGRRRQPARRSQSERHASVEVLKSAAASSIYGSKAANGVIIITTKRGSGGKPKATITQRLGCSSLLRGPGVRVFDTTAAFDLYNSPEDSAVIRSLEINGKLPCTITRRRPPATSRSNYETALDVSGGNDNTKYFVSGGWSHTGGIINNTDAGRQSLRMNLDQRLNEKLKLTSQQLVHAHDHRPRHDQQRQQRRRHHVRARLHSELRAARARERRVPTTRVHVPECESAPDHRAGRQRRNGQPVYRWRDAHLSGAARREA